MASYKSEFRMDIGAKDGTRQVLGNLQNNLRKSGRAGKKSGVDTAAAWTKAIGVMMGIKAVKGAVDKAFESVQAGRMASMVGVAFQSIHDDADALLVKLKEVSRGAGDATSLQALANRWQLAGKEMSVLMRALPAAYKLAAATGEDYLGVAQKIAMVMIGGRKSQIERYTGMLDEIKAYRAHAQAIGKSAAELTILDKKTALVEAGFVKLEGRVASIRVDVEDEELGRLKGDWDDLVSDMEVRWKSFALSLAREARTIWSARGAGSQPWLAGVNLAEREAEMMAAVRRKLGRAEEWTGGVGPLDPSRPLREATTIQTNWIAAEFDRLKSHMAAGVDEWKSAFSEMRRDAETALRERTRAEQDKRYAAEAKYWNLRKEHAALAVRQSQGLNYIEERRLEKLDREIKALEESGRISRDIQRGWLEFSARSMFGGVVEGLRQMAEPIRDAIAEAVRPAAARFGPTRAEREERVRQELEDRIEVGMAELAAYREAQDRAAKEDLARVKASVREEMELRGRLRDVEALIAGESPEARTQRMAAEEIRGLTEGGLVDLKHFELAKATIQLEADQRVREIKRKREEEDFRRSLERTRENSAALSEVFRGLTASGVRSTSQWSQGLAATGEGFRSVGAALTKTDKETGKLTSATHRYSLAGAGALGAAAAWVKGERKKAVILAAMEGAHAAATFATPWVSAAHGLAAGLYGAIAGGAFGGRGAGRKSKTIYRAPAAATSAAAGAGAANVTYIFNYRGPTSGRDAAREFANSLNKHQAIVNLDPGVMAKGAGRF